MKVEVSVGEAIDKLSILELKNKKIIDLDKKKEIQKEIDILSECYRYKKNFPYFYKLLFYVNETIWDLTNIIKNKVEIDNNFATISNQIFEFNQKRFRIKNWFNLVTTSNLKEQKSYSETYCKILVKDIDIFYKKIPEIYFLGLEYDKVIILSTFNNIIQNEINMPVIIYKEYTDDIENTDSENNLINVSTIILDNFSIDPIIKPNFEFNY